jgi:hypothetical protein
LGPGAGKLAEQLPPATEQWTQQARDREHHVAVRDGQEHVLAQPLGPQELLLLLARGAEAAAPTREGDEHAPAALPAPKPCEAVHQQAALQELPQNALDNRPQRPVLPQEAHRPYPQQLLEVLLDETVTVGY